MKGVAPFTYVAVLTGLTCLSNNYDASYICAEINSLCIFFILTILLLGETSSPPFYKQGNRGSEKVLQPLKT